MGKKKPGSRVKKGKSTPSPAERVSRIDTVCIMRGVWIGITILILVTPSYWLFGKFEPYLLFTFAGIAIGLSIDQWWESVLATSVYALAVAFIYPRFFTLAAYAHTINNADPLFYGDIILRYIYVDALLPLVATSSLETWSAAGLLAVAFLYVFSVSLGFFWLKNQTTLFQKLPGRLRESAVRDPARAIGVVVTAIASVALLVTTYQALGPMIERVSTGFDPGTYQTDYHIYERTYALMREGRGFYDSHLEAIKGHIGVQEQGDTAYPRFTPMWVRHPFTFYLWRVLGIRDVSDPVRLAPFIVLAAILLVSFGFERFGVGAVALPLLLFIYPFMWMAMVWEDFFSPDFWGGLFMLLSFGFLLNKRWHAGIVAGVAAALCREQLWFWAGAVFVATAIYAFRSKRWGYAIASSSGLAVVVGSYLLHWHTLATSYKELVAPKATTSPVAFVNSTWSEALPRIERVTSYLTLPYSMHRYFGFWFLILAIVFFVAALIRFRSQLSLFSALTTGATYITLYLLLLKYQPHQSQYWGLHILPLALSGTAGLFLLPLLMLRRRPEAAHARKHTSRKT